MCVKWYIITTKCTNLYAEVKVLPWLSPCVFQTLYLLPMKNDFGILLFQQVDNIEQTLLQWTEKVCILHQNYSWLLFFSVPKLFHLHSLLDNINLDLDAIVRELSFLFENSVTICEKLKPDIQVCLLFQIELINQDISSFIECN